MNKISFQIPPAVQRVGNVRPEATPSVRAGSSANAVSFDTVLQKEIANREAVQFSAHARERLTQRDIRLDEVEMNRIERAIKQAAAKGARNTLLLGGDYALIVNVPNRTVVTAMQQRQMAERVVTNIDSTVLIA